MSDADNLVHTLLEERPDELIQLLADNGYGQLGNYFQVEQSALHFLSNGGSEALIAMHPDYSLIIEHYLSTQPTATRKESKKKKASQDKYIHLPVIDFDVKPFFLFLSVLVCAIVVLKLFKD